MSRRDLPAGACQRWSPGRIQAWRWPGPEVLASRYGFDASRYGVDVIDEARARAFVLVLHYSGSYPAASKRFGMFDLAGPEPRLVGVAVLSVPARKEVLTSVFPDLVPYRESLELGRFVLLDEVPAHAETWFLGQCRRLAAADGLRGLVMFSDPVERRRADGLVVMPGHWGAMYQASSALYTGRGTARTITMLPDGRVFSCRAAQKVRRQECGHEYAEQQLIALGARPRRAGQDPADWLAGALADVHARKVRHPGCLRYACRLGTSRRERAAVRIAPRPGPYPKKDLGQLDLFRAAA